jgi:hypothetical protein
MFVPESSEDLDFQRYLSCSLFFNCLRSDVVIHFVDIIVIVDCLNFPYIKFWAHKTNLTPPHLEVHVPS